MATSYSATAPDGAKRLVPSHVHNSDGRVETKNDSEETMQTVTLESLPLAILAEIFNRLRDATDLARCAAVNRAFRSCFRSVTVVHLRWSLMIRNLRPKAVAPFKDIVTGTLNQLKRVETLRLEVEDGFVDSRFKDDDIERKSLWLSEKSFSMIWISQVKDTLQNITVIDFGLQAIYHATPLLQQLAANCKQLQTLELRNMYLDSTDVEKMNKVTSVTLRCVKLSPKGLTDIVNCMPQLEILMLATVVGLEEAVFESDSLKEVCLGLATYVKAVRLTTRHLEKLQLKLSGAQQVTVKAPDLKCLAVSVEKSEKTVVQFENVKLLKELLVGGTEFKTLSNLISANALLDKVFLDVPCMGFEENGEWKGLIPNMNLPVPEMEAIRSCCPNLQTMSVGPGLWYALEENIPKQGPQVPKWPTVRRLIVHMIVVEVDKSKNLLSAYVSTIPTLSLLEIYIHTDSHATVHDFNKLKDKFPQVDVICGTWKRGLRFDCFSF